MSLLLGMIEPAAGCIRLNDRVLTAAGADAWLRHVAYVPQQPYLFQTSLRENIRMAKPEASPEEVETAFALAGGAALAAALPGGYETLLGPGGVELSGGERRRVALARAFLTDAPVLLCDEATSGLDPESEAALQQAFERLCQGRTVLVIAHRLGTVRRADQIAVLESGQIIETGHHEELLERQGAYASLLAAARGERE
jgi:ABC-type multidrug transport system fused ATPase/permease subunit